MQESDLRGIQLSLALNALLFTAKLSITLMTHSMILFASTLDSGVDLFSCSGFLLVERWIAVPDSRYPDTKKKAESLAGIVFCVVMIIGAIQIVFESAIDLVQGIVTIPESDICSASNDPDCIDDAVIGAVLGATILTKAIAYRACQYLYRRSNNMLLKSLMTDHYHDLLSNGLAFFLLACWWLDPVILWWLDPAGGIFISAWMCYDWSHHLREYTDQLLGFRANQSINRSALQSLVPSWEKIKSVNRLDVYHAGPDYAVKLDITPTPCTSEELVGCCQDIALTLTQVPNVKHVNLSMSG